MNLTLSEVIQTSPNGEDFLKIPEIYIRGNHIKYLRLPEQVCIFESKGEFFISKNTNHFRLWTMPKKNPCKTMTIETKTSREEVI